MGLRTWSKSNLEYGRRVLSSGLEGAHAGREAFLNGRPITPVLSESVCTAWKPAVVGAVVGVLASYPGKHRSIRKTIGYGILGAVVGFGVGVAWGSRRLTASVARGTMRNIGKVRDEHWLENNPITYA